MTSDPSIEIEQSKPVFDRAAMDAFRRKCNLASIHARENEYYEIRRSIDDIRQSHHGLEDPAMDELLGKIDLHAKESMDRLARKRLADNGADSLDFRELAEKHMVGKYVLHGDAVTRVDRVVYAACAFVILTGPCASLYSITQPALGGISDVRPTFTVSFDCPGDLGKLREVSYDQTLELVSANAPELLPQFHDAFDRSYDYSNASNGYPIDHEV